jgi:hypothetical protein
MVERMLKAIPSKVAPLWAPILLEDQIKKASKFVGKRMKNYSKLKFNFQPIEHQNCPSFVQTNPKYYWIDFAKRKIEVNGNWEGMRKWEWKIPNSLF